LLGLAKGENFAEDMSEAIAGMAERILKIALPSDKRLQFK